MVSINLSCGYAGQRPIENQPTLIDCGTHSWGWDRCGNDVLVIVALVYFSAVWSKVSGYMAMPCVADEGNEYR